MEKSLLELSKLVCSHLLGQSGPWAHALFSPIILDWPNVQQSRNMFGLNALNNGVDFSGGLGAGVIAVIVLIVISAVLVVLVLFVAKKNNLCCFKYKQVPVKEGAAGVLTQIFQKAQMSLNKMEHKKRHSFLAQFSCPFSWCGFLCSDC